MGLCLAETGVGPVLAKRFSSLPFGGDMNRPVSQLIWISAITLLCIAPAIGQSPTPQASNSANAAPNSIGGTPADAPTFSQRSPRYRLRPGDGMDLIFQYSSEFNQSITVQPDGYVTLREIGDVNVNGLTLPELKNKLEDEYSKLLVKPEIGINLKQFDKPYFTAAGQVGKPGRYELQGDTTVVEAIALAGGFTTASKHSQVVLVRRVDDRWAHAQLIDVKKLMASKDMREDVHLQPGDMLIVPQNRLSKVRSFIPSTGLTMLPTQF
jgi:polysaccharide export outer membrane protein